MKKIKGILLFIIAFYSASYSFAEYRCALLDKKSCNEIALRMKDAISEFLKAKNISDFDLESWDGQTVIDLANNSNYTDPFHMSLTMSYDSNNLAHQKYAQDFSQGIKKVHFPVKEVTVFGGYLAISLDSYVKKMSVILEDYEKESLNFFVSSKALHVSLIKISGDNSDKHSIQIDQLYDLNVKKIFRDELKNLITSGKNSSKDYCNSTKLGDINVVELNQKTVDIRERILSMIRVREYDVQSTLQDLLKDGLTKDRQLRGYDLDSRDLNDLLDVFIKRMFFQMSFNERIGSFVFRSSSKNIQFKLAEGKEKDSPVILKTFWDKFDKLIDQQIVNMDRIDSIYRKKIFNSKLDDGNQVSDLLEKLSFQFYDLMCLDFDKIEEAIV